MTILETQQLCRTYGRRRGVDNVDLSLQEGEILGFLGPNGAGKSTTIRMLMGFLRPSSGAARINGLDCWQHSAQIKQDTGYVAGDVRLYPWLTLNRALELVGEIRGQSLKKPGHELAERFGLEPDLPVRKMSRGNRQKLALIAALAHRPGLVVLDEPTSGLDPLVQDTLADCLRELADDGHSIFFSSHTLSEVETLCDRVAVIRDGQIVVNEQLARLKAKAPRTVVLTFASQQEALSAVLPDGVERVTQQNAILEVRLQGTAVPMMQWAVSHSVIDITVGPPNLETLFRGYYASETEVKS